MIQPAIVIVTYNRELSLKRLLESIKNAKYTEKNITLIISIDYSNKQSVIKNIAEEFEWSYGNKIIRTYKENQGLKKHVLSCGDLTDEYEGVIILEDDLYVAEDYYSYAKAALNFYENNEKIAGIALYSHAWNAYGGYGFSPVITDKTNYFGQFSITWGQAWSKNQWQHFKLWYYQHANKFPQKDTAIPERVFLWGEQSWGKYFFYYIIKNDLYYVMPYTARTTNFSEPGIHATDINVIHQVSLQRGQPEYNFAKFSPDAIKYDAFFERIDFKKIFKVDVNEMCIDINGCKHIPKNKRYLLTCIQYPFPIIKSYGMQLKPIDANIDFDIPGNDIFLYDLENVDRLQPYKKHPKRIKRMKYEAGGYWWYDLLPIIKSGIVWQIKACLCKRKKK